MRRVIQLCYEHRTNTGWTNRRDNGNSDVDLTKFDVDEEPTEEMPGQF